MKTNTLPFSIRLCLIFFIGQLIAYPAKAQALLDPASQAKFVQPLPVPSLIDARQAIPTLHMEVTEFAQDLGLRHPSSGEALLTTVWGYNGQYPGPTILAKANVPLEVYWHNRLTENGTDEGQVLPHLLPVDPSLHWALGAYDSWEDKGVPLVTHLHGGHTESASDGLPEAWYTPNFTITGKHYEKGHPGAPYQYANDQEAATLWYHDHALGITRLNVYAGLAGFYLLTDATEQALIQQNKLPAAPYDLGIAIQDRMFTADGQLYIPSEPEEAEAPDPSILPEFFGNFILVNGKIWPVLEAEARQYRLRLLNGSDSRFYNLFFTDPKNEKNLLQFWQIGSDNGLLPQPVVHDQLLIAPGERKDIIIDLTDPALLGQTIIIRNNARSPYPFGDTPNPQHEGKVMAIRINQSLNTNYPLTPVPTRLRPALPEPPASRATRQLILFEGEDEYGRLKPMLGTLTDGALDWEDEITENPHLDATESWEIYNLTPDAHPIHLHLVFFKVESTQKFKADYDEETGVVKSVKLIGQPKAPDLGQQGRKDTYPIMPGEMARFTATFDRPGRYVWHCHILSHEDHEMMRPYYVGDILQQQLAQETMRQLADPLLLPGKAAYLLYPNPASQAVTLQLSSPESGLLSIGLYDQQGRLVKLQQYLIDRPGMQQLRIATESLPAGLYHCSIRLNEYSHQERILISK